MLEPEGLNSGIIYPNGISTSLPEDIQELFLKSIKGLESVKIAQAGYAIEYDHIDPRALKKTLELKNIDNLFFAAAGAHPGAGIPGVLSSAKVVENLIK